MANKFYITTAIAYVNGNPHVGFAMEVIQADVLARFHRLRGDDTFFLTGTDEHGQKISDTAKRNGVSEKEWTDSMSLAFKEMVNMLNVSNDGFVRTTDDRHKKGAQKLWMKLKEAGDIYKSSYVGNYCVGCEAFLADKDLVDGKCAVHNMELKKVEEENYFFRLSKYSDEIYKLIESDEIKIVPVARKNEILSVIREGLKDISFSRPKSSLEWGIEVPDDPSHVMYVWGDALSNYITAIGFVDDEEMFNRYWPCDVHIIGKDILRFHAGVWIGMLLSSGLALPKEIYVHGYVTSEGEKMSKSLGNVVNPKEYVEKFSADAFRYYMMREIPTTLDGDFSKDRFFVLYSSELANTFGNLVSRVLSMDIKYFDGKVPDGNRNNNFVKVKVEEVWDNYEKFIFEFDLKKALGEVVSLAEFANKYVDDNKPWELYKNGDEKLRDVMYDLTEMVRHIGVLLLPFIPESAEKILGYLNFDYSKFDYFKLKQWGGIGVGGEVVKPKPLFVRVED